MLSVGKAHLDALGYSAIGLSALASLWVTVRASRVAILVRHGQVVVRRLFRTQRFGFESIANVEVGEEETILLQRLYVVLVLQNGKRVKCSDVYLWSFNNSGRKRAESWVSAIQSCLPTDR